MMRIRLKISIAGNRFSYRPGQVVDWPSDSEAQRYIDAGMAELVEQPAPAKAAKADPTPNPHESPSASSGAGGASSPNTPDAGGASTSAEEGAGPAGGSASPAGGPQDGGKESTVKENPPAVKEKRDSAKGKGDKPERADAKQGGGKNGKGKAGEKATLDR